MLQNISTVIYIGRYHKSITFINKSGIKYNMSKLIMKLRLFKAKKGIRNNTIAEAIDVTPQTITDWLSPKKTPKKVNRSTAEKLVEFSDNFFADVI